MEHFNQTQVIYTHCLFKVCKFTESSCSTGSITLGFLPYINITTAQDHCCINYTWTQPPTIEGVPVTGYQYNITTVDGVLTNTITDTFIQYCPQVFGDYTVSLAGVNGAGLGEINQFNDTLQPCELH